MYTYYISVGSNIGDKRGYINFAFESLQEYETVSEVISSSLIETEPWGYTDQASFINGIWSCKSTLAPLQMLGLLQSLEQRAGRERLIHWGPRTLDLDIILAFDEDKTMISVCNKRLTIPHPYFWDRIFVLEPLSELLPTFTYKGTTIGERLAHLSLL